MFRRLVADGLVRQADGRDLVLTTAGRAAADAIFRRHALLEWLLTSVVGLGWAESDEEAARLQGALSPRVEARLDEMLGHPPTCPHGNPIDAETARQRPDGTPLSEIEAGQRATIYRITEEAEEDAGLLSYLEARALTPGAADHGPRPLRIARLADARRPARPGDARAAARRRSSTSCPATRIRRCSTACPRADRDRTAAAALRLRGRCPTPRSASGSRPSPTGPLHIGTARTALFNYLFARHVGGTFLFRLEDTDVAREHARRSSATSSRASTGSGITWDEGPDPAGGGDVGPYAPYRQMQRLAALREAADRLLAGGPRVSLLLHARGARRRPAPPRRPRSSRRATSAAARR